jgi:hypothetical protein
MKIKAVEMMRNIRDKISSDIQEMHWDDEKDYLKNHMQTFHFLTKISSQPEENNNKKMHLTENRYAVLDR